MKISLPVPAFMNKRIVRVGHIVSVILLALVLFAWIFTPTPGLAVDIPKLEPMEHHDYASREIVDKLIRFHYVKQKVNDDLSSYLFDNYMEDLDPHKIHFTQKDIANLEAHRHRLDEALKTGSLEPAFEIFHLFQTRRVERLQYLVDIVDTRLEELDLSSEDSIRLDRSEQQWFSDDDELHMHWENRLKSTVIDMRLADKDFAEIRETLSKRYRQGIARALQVNAEDVFQTYMNSLSTLYDPHTSYFSPRTSEDFNIRMSLSLEGIGAVLSREDEYATIQRLIPAGPADKSGKLQPSDRILAVGQENDGEMTDVVGWRLDDVVDRIRGPKGTKVLLEVLSDGQPQSSARVVEIIRDKVDLDDQSAKSKVLEYQRNGETYRIGVIRLPAFYLDIRGMQEGLSDYRSTTRDVKRLIEDLKTRKVDGIVMDLRNNSGGSLDEANSLVGLFIPLGPTVQIRDSRNKVRVLSDKDDEQVYEGPLLVLVNRISASASEIFAGAIQDYRRGIVAGTRTYGKGTVQTLLPLKHGQLKYTQAKFYRISGKSTQNRGILPDIVFPQKVYDSGRIGENTLDGALPWDAIRTVAYRRDDRFTVPVLAQLKEAHQRRTVHAPEFVYMRNVEERARLRQNEQWISLNENIRRKRKEEDEAWFENQENLRKGFGDMSDTDQRNVLDQDAGQTPSKVAESTDEVSESVSETQQQGQDPVLQESGNILLDYIVVSSEYADSGKLVTSSL